LNGDKLGGAMRFLWVASRNYIMSYITRKPEVISEDITEHQDNIYEDIDLDAVDSRNEYRKKILAEINLRLSGQKIVNTTNAVFLLLLKDYIIANDYDVRGFGDYVMSQMNLKLSTYRAIAGRLGIRTKVLNEKLINK